MIQRLLLLLTALPMLLLANANNNRGFPAETAKNGITWLTDFETAKKCVAKKGKSLFVLFTGSDWCGWCKKLEKEVLNSKEFSQKVGDQFVFVKLDYPMRLPQTVDVQIQNGKLKTLYGVESFPRVLVFDSQMRKIAETGYTPGGGAEYAERLLELTDEHFLLNERMAKVNASTPDEELKELFEMSRRLGEPDYQAKVLELGVEKNLSYFLLEHYQERQQAGATDIELADLRQRLQANADGETHYRLAIMDYVKRSVQKDSKKEVDQIAAPLINYLDRHAEGDTDHAWRVQLQVSTLYRNAGNAVKAATFLRQALKTAPDTHKAEVKAALDGVR